MTAQVRGLLAIGAASALGSAQAGWWAVPAVAAVSAIAARGTARPWLIGAATTLGWLLLLSWDALRGPVGDVARLVGAIVPVGAGGMVLLTLGFAFALGWSVTRVVNGLWPAR
ncbi:MAG: hypothetical protein NW201_01025 [Gemmatimonadales bacterium]|nr:hypothetical protein [Gemmatimonadales bacterium]